MVDKKKLVCCGVCRYQSLLDEIGMETFIYFKFLCIYRAYQYSSSLWKVILVQRTVDIQQLSSYPK